MKNKILNLVGSTFLVVGVVAPIIIFNKKNEENLQIYNKSKDVIESIQNGVRIKEIETGEVNSAAIVTDPLGNDYLYTWGNNEYGQLGIGSFGGATHVPQKVSLPEGYKLRDLEVFSYHMGVIANDSLGNDHIYLWGRNDLGQLGMGDDVYRSSPKEMSISGINEVLDLSLSYYSSGAFVVDSLGREKFYAWGNNGYGELGNGTSGSTYETPQLISTLSSDMKFKDFEFGGFTGGVVLTDSNEIDHLYTWGKNDVGQTGLNSIALKETKPKEVEFPIIGKITNFSLGYSHASISLRDSLEKEHLYMWGDNEYGQLGNDEAGEGALSRVPIEIKISSSYDEILEINLGFTHSSVILKEDDEKELYMWGDNSFYIIEDSKAKYYDVPQKISLPTSSFNNYDLEVKSGDRESFILLTNKFGEQELFVWGLNTNGQLAVDESIESYVRNKKKINFFNSLPQTTTTSFIEEVSENEFVFEINVSSELSEDFSSEDVLVYNSNGTKIGDVTLFDDSDNIRSIAYKFLTTIVDTEEAEGEYLYWSVDGGETLNLISKKKYGVNENITTVEVVLYLVMLILGVTIISLLIIFLILVLLKRKNNKDDEDENDYLDFDDYDKTRKSKKQKREQDKIDKRNNVLDGV